MIRPYLRDLINGHKPTEELNNDGDSERVEWKVQVVMQNNCISTKDFEETQTIYSASKPVEIFMGTDTDDTIDRFFDTFLQRFQQGLVTSNDRGSGFTNKNVALVYYYFQKIVIQRVESFIMSPELIVNKGATINPKNEKDNKCVQYSITSALNYKKINKKNISKKQKI